MSNRLPTLAADLATLHREISQHYLTVVQKTLAAGQLLIEAKSLAGHGDWLPFLAEAGIPERTAQRYMRLWQSGFKSDTVSDLGGIKATLAFLATWKMPGADEALNVETGEGDECNFAFIWRDETYPDHIVIAACIGDQTVRTKRPMLPWIEVEGCQPVDTVVTWLIAQQIGAIADWKVETVNLRLAQAVIDPLVWFAMVEEHEARVA